MKTIITFTAFLLSKTSRPAAQMHPNVLAHWRIAYEQEVPADQREGDTPPKPDAGTQAKPVGGGPDEVLLEASAAPDAEEVTLEAVGEIAGSLAELTIEAAGDDPAKIPTFNMTAYNGGPMFPSGWWEDHPIIIDLAGMEIPQSVPIDASHREEIGHTTSIDKAVKSLKAKGLLSAHSPNPADTDPAAVLVRRIVRMGTTDPPFPHQASIAPSVRKSKIEFTPAGEEVKVNGRTFPGPVSVARTSKLQKIAILSLGADSTTSTSIAAQPKKGQQMNPFDTWLVANDFDPALVNSNPKQKAKLEGQWKAETAPPPPAATPPAKVEGQTAFAQKMEAIKDENLRVEHIRDQTALQAEAAIGNPEKVQQLQDLADTAVADKTMTAAKFDLALLRISRFDVPMMTAPKQPKLSEKLIEAGFAKYTGLASREKDFGAETLEASDKAFGKGGLSMLRLIGMAARRNGWRGESVQTDLKRSLKAAFRDDDELQASTGPSTYSISNVLSNVTNLHIRDAFNSVENVWRMIAFISSVNDYKEITTVDLTGDFTYKKVARGGEVKHGSFGDLTYGNKADLFALLIGIDEQDLVNDSPRALTSMSRRMGRGGAQTMNQVLWAEWLDDATFFPIDKSKANYDDGAVDSMLTAVGLENMNGIFRAQTDPSGNPLGLRPKILLVPPALEGAALALMAPALTGSTNIWANRFTVVSSDYLTNPLAWYLLANPQDMPAIEMVFLNGQEMPTTEQADMAIDRLGIVIRGKHSFGVRKQEYRAAVKAKGAV